jgi:TolA-binding protein
VKQIFYVLLCVLCLSACKTKSELRREQELERIQQTLKDVKGDRADVESVIDENRQELSRLANVVEAEAHARRKDNDDIRKELGALATRLQALEQRVVAEELAAKQPPPEPPKASYEAGKKLFEEGQFGEAAEILRSVAKTHSRTEEGKRAHFLLAEALFANKDYASAAIEYGEFRKIYTKDALIPNAIYRQAQAFRSMGKKQEAKLFFQDLIERFPKSPFAAKAKSELKKNKG